MGIGDRESIVEFDYYYFFELPIIQAYELLFLKPSNYPTVQSSSF